MGILIFGGCCLVVWLVVIGYHPQHSGANLAKATVYTLLLLAAYGFAGIEWLSLLSLVKPNALVALWSVPMLGLLILKQKQLTKGRIAVANFFSRFRWHGLWLGYLALVAAPLVFCSLWFAPNNGDGMRYHLMRIEHWLWNGHVNFYPTNDIRQLSFNPLAEYMMLHLRAITGTDVWVQSVQLASFGGILLLVWMTTGILGFARPARHLTTLATGTTAMLLLEASTVQNDLVASFFLCASLWQAMLLATGKGGSWFVLMLAVGLGAATKYIVPLMLVAPALLLLPAFYRLGFYRQPSFWLSLPLAILFVMPGVLRNSQAFGHPLQPPPGHALHKAVGNAAMAPAAIGGNLLKHTGNLIALPFGGPFNRYYTQWVAQYHTATGVPLLHPAYNYSREAGGRVYPFECSFKLSEDGASAPVTCLLFAAALVAALWQAKRHRLARRVLAAGAIAAGMWLLTGIFIKYSPWSSRHLIPFLLLAQLPAGWLLGRVASQQPKWGFTGLGILLLAMAIWPVYLNPYKQLLPNPLTGQPSQVALSRMEHYFIGEGQTSQAGAMQQLAATLQKNDWPVAAALSETAIAYPLVVASRYGQKTPLFSTIAYHPQLQRYAGQQPKQALGNRLLLTNQAPQPGWLPQPIQTIDTFGHLYLLRTAEALPDYLGPMPAKAPQENNR